MGKIPEHDPGDGRMWGRALRSTPDEIVLAAQVTPEDIESAKTLWERAAPEGTKKLLGKRKKRKKKN